MALQVTSGHSWRAVFTNPASPPSAALAFTVRSVKPNDPSSWTTEPRKPIRPAPRSFGAAACIQRNAVRLRFDFELAALGGTSTNPTG